MKKFVVIGASAASVSFMTKLRSLDKNSQIVCFSGEPSIPYNRCLLADFLTGELSVEQLNLKPDQFFAEQNIQLFLNHWVIKLDLNGKRVLVQSDQGQNWHEYDYLFLGMGTKPFVPSCLQDATVQGLFTFHTLEDMHKIQKYMQNMQPKTAVVIGAGLNGIEAVSALLEQNVAVSVIEAQATILPGQVDGEVTVWVSDVMRNQGVMIVAGRKVVELCKKNDQVVGVRLDSGAEIFADMVIVAAGSVVNLSLVRETEIKTSASSVLVDSFLKTNIESVFAAGDLCAVPDMMTGQPVRSTTWSDAMLQGLCAATNFSDKPRQYPGVIGLRDSYFFGSYFYACGQTVCHDQSVQTVEMISDCNVRKVYLKNDQIVGFVLIGDISCLAQYKQWYVCKQKIDRSML